MSFWANKNSSAPVIKAKEAQICPWAAGWCCHFVLLVYVLGRRHGPEFHGDPERSPVNRGRGEEGGEGRGACLRQKVSGLVWFGCRGSPLYPGFPAAGWGGRLVSSGAAEKCQSTQRADLRSYGNKTNSQWAEASYRRYTLKTRGHLRAKGNQVHVTHQKYSWMGSLENHQIWDVK